MAVDDDLTTTIPSLVPRFGQGTSLGMRLNNTDIVYMYTEY